VKTKKGEIKTVSVSAMQEQKYRAMTAAEKLEFLQKENPKDGVVKIVIDTVPKFIKFKLPNGAYRLVKSFKESGPAKQLKTREMPTKESAVQDFDVAYDVLVSFIDTNKLVSDAKVSLLKGEVKENFMELSTEDKLGVIADLSKLSNGRNQGLKALKKSGGFAEEQLRTSTNLIKKDTALIYQSPTGLFETRKKLE